jgi:hypothetical protein
MVLTATTMAAAVVVGASLLPHILIHNRSNRKIAL